MAPVMLAIGALRAGFSEILVVVGASAALLALVIARLAGLVSRHERGEQREHALREAAAELVAAWKREDIYRVAVDSALEIVSMDGASVGLAIGSVQDFTIVASAGERTAVGFGLRPESLPTAAAEELSRTSPARGAHRSPDRTGRRVGSRPAGGAGRLPGRFRHPDAASAEPGGL